MKVNEMKTGKSVADLGMMYEGGDFDCSFEKLTSLEGSPAVVDGHFSCQFNKLASLEGAPREVGKIFMCADNELTTLKGGPQKVGSFVCASNRLTALDGAPQEVGIDFVCSDNPSNNMLTSLKDIHRHIKRIGNRFIAYNCPIKSHVLGLLLIKDLKTVLFDNKEVENIINAHLDGGSMRSAMDCQHALIKAGFPEYAKL